MNAPVVMNCIEIVAPGGPEVLRPAQAAVPAPGPGEVLIKVAAAGVNRPDVLQRQGRYDPPPGASPLPGLEVAGEIAALGEGAAGEGAAHWRVGDKVCALLACCNGRTRSMTARGRRRRPPLARPRPGLRAVARRRLRRIRRRAGGPGAAGSTRAEHDAGRRLARNRLHRLDQRV